MRWIVLGVILGLVAISQRPKKHVEEQATPVARVTPTVRDDRPVLVNHAPYIPVQCYAKIKPGRNTCASCHRASVAPNFVDDEDVQLQYSFPKYATENHWTNALHPPAPVHLDDASTLAYVRVDNYKPFQNCAFHPDAEGWDHDARGDLTGWRSYAYTPLGGMFWPTNGSFGDAYIRLPAAYRPDQVTYALNLAILESMIRRTDVAIAPTDERAYGLDLDGDGERGVARKVKFRFPNDLHYIAADASPVVAGLYPVGTEILHSVRYLDVVDGVAKPAARLKELRYMRKQRWLNYAELDLQAKREQREKEQDPDRLRFIFGDETRGLGTGTGWTIQAQIEAVGGTLRSQTIEETGACIGCHGGIGATTDSTFSFARKTAWGPQSVANIIVDDNDFGATPGSVIPPPARALDLDRAYLAIVRAQSYIEGRDVFLAPPALETKVVQDSATGITKPL